MRFNLTLPLPPSVNEYLGYRVIFINGRYIPQPYSTKAAKDYTKYVATVVKRELKKQKWKINNKEKYINVDLIYYVNKKRKDADNMNKVLFDSLVKAGLFPDDDILLPKVHNIYIDSNNPRVEIFLSVSDKIGIFDDEEHLKIFNNNNCNKCKKSTYKRGCSIKTKALENRIQEEIKNDICLKRNPL